MLATQDLLSFFKCEYTMYALIHKARCFPDLCKLFLFLLLTNGEVMVGLPNFGFDHLAESWKADFISFEQNTVFDVPGFCSSNQLWSSQGPCIEMNLLLIMLRCRTGDHLFLHSASPPFSRCIDKDLHWQWEGNWILLHFSKSKQSLLSPDM